MITEKISAQKVKQNIRFGFQPQTQTTSVFLNPSLNDTETTENLPPTEITGISIPPSFAQIPDITIPLHVPTKTIPSNSNAQNDPHSSRKRTLKIFFLV